MSIKSTRECYSSTWKARNWIPQRTSNKLSWSYRIHKKSPHETSRAKSPIFQVFSRYAYLQFLSWLTCLLCLMHFRQWFYNFCLCPRLSDRTWGFVVSWILHSFQWTSYIFVSLQIYLTLRLCRSSLWRSCRWETLVI